MGFNPYSQWYSTKPLWIAQKEIRDKLNMKQIWSNGVKQRYMWINEGHDCDHTPIELEFSFDIEDLNIDNL